MAPRVGLEHDVGVLGIRRRGEGEARRPRAGRRAVDLEAAGHAQVHDQGLAAIERREHVLGAPLQALDPRAGQPLDEALGQGESAGPAAAPRRADSRAPARTGARPRRTVSTSGSSGIGPCLAELGSRRPWRDALRSRQRPARPTD